HARARYDDDRVPGLAGARRSPIEHAAARAAFAPDNIGADARPGVLVPDLDELQRHDAYRLAVFRIHGDRSLVVQVGVRDADVVQLGADDGDGARWRLAHE